MVKSGLEGMSLVGHLEEMRIRLIRTGIVLAISIIVGMYFAPNVLTILQETAPIQVVWNVFSPGDALSIYLQVSVVLGFVITVPYALFQLWCFMKPGLKKAEQKAVLKYFPLIVCSFVIGMAFGYFVVFRMALLFMTSLIDQIQLQQMYGLDRYISFMLGIVIPVAIVFELPVVVMFLTVIRVLNPDLLKKVRKYAYFILLIVSSIITPPDIVSDLIVCIPLVILYECSILISSFVMRKQEQEGLAFTQ